MHMRTLGEGRSHGRLQIMRELFGIEGAPDEAAARGRARCRARQRASAAAPRHAVRIGTRASPLALAQARTVAALFGDAELVPITTTGDARRCRPYDKERWVKELELALLAGEIDLARAQRQGRAERAARRASSSSARRRAAIRSTRSSAPRRWPRCATGARVGHREPAPRRAAARAARRSRRRRAARQRRHAPAQARPRARSTRSCWPPPACSGWAAGSEIGCVLAELVPCAGQGTLVLEARTDDAAARAPRAAVTDAATLGRAVRRAHARRGPGRELQHPARRARDDRRRGDRPADVRRPARRLGVAARRDAAGRDAARGGRARRRAAAGRRRR